MHTVPDQQACTLRSASAGLQVSWWAQLPRAALEQPLLYASLAVSLVVFVLLCLVRYRPAGKTRQCGIVIAADEARTLHKPLL